MNDDIYIHIYKQVVEINCLNLNFVILVWDYMADLPCFVLQKHSDPNPLDVILSSNCIFLRDNR